MAVQRYVNSKFWSDPWIERLSSEQKLLFLYLITNEHTTIAGAYELSIRRMSAESGLTEGMITEALEAFHKAGKVAYVDGWIVLRNFVKHQKNWSQPVQEGIRRIRSALPPAVLKAIDTVPIQPIGPIDRVGIGPFVTESNKIGPSNNSDSDSDSDLDIDSDSDARNDRASPSAAPAGLDWPAGPPAANEADADPEKITESVSQQLGPSVIDFSALPPHMRVATERARLKLEADAKAKAEHLAQKTADYHAGKGETEGDGRAPLESIAPTPAEPGFLAAPKPRASPDPAVDDFEDFPEEVVT